MAERDPQGDEMIGRTEEAEAEHGAGRDMAAANLFDLRRIIGGLFILYGIVLTIIGITDSQQEIGRAAGVRINLWMGLGMLALGILFVIWALTRPLGQQLAEAEAEPAEGKDHPVPRAVDTQSLGSEEPQNWSGGDLASEEERRGRPGGDG
jgi:hypothetical protein